MDCKEDVKTEQPGKKQKTNSNLSKKEGNMMDYLKEMIFDEKMTNLLEIADNILSNMDHKMPSDTFWQEATSTFDMKMLKELNSIMQKMCQQCIDSQVQDNVEDIIDDNMPDFLESLQGPMFGGDEKKYLQSSLFNTTVPTAIKSMIIMVKNKNISKQLFFDKLMEYMEQDKESYPELYTVIMTGANQLWHS